ncbi:hypothetical protein V6Z12_D01G254900 [Gossypium hirsutum]
MSWKLDVFSLGETIGFETSDRISSLETSFACFLLGDASGSDSSSRHSRSRFNSGFVPFPFSVISSVEILKQNASSSIQQRIRSPISDNYSIHKRKIRKKKQTLDFTARILKSGIQIRIQEQRKKNLTAKQTNKKNKISIQSK